MPVTRKPAGAAAHDAHGDRAQVTLADIWQAGRALRGIARRTPLLHDARLDEVLDARVYVKAEHLQQTGSFKVRGAFNRVRSLSPEARARGILTVSAGNAALGAAYAARVHGVSCTVIMPARPVQAKLEAVRSLGAEVILHGQSTDEMFAKAGELIARHGYTLVHPFDQPEVIAGQGTVGLEILEDAPDDVRAVYVPCSGGGLLAGIALAVKALRPGLRVIGVQPRGAASIRLSLEAGAVTESPPVDTLADGLIARRCGELNFGLIRRHVDDVVLVSDDEILEAMALIWRTLRQAVEPAGAAALAGARRRGAGGDGIVVVTSGANVDLALLQHALQGGTADAWKRGRA